jgi:hypothetical protein
MQNLAASFSRETDPAAVVSDLAESLASQRAARKDVLVAAIASTQEYMKKQAGEYAGLLASEGADPGELAVLLSGLRIQVPGLQQGVYTCVEPFTRAHDGIMCVMNIAYEALIEGTDLHEQYVHYVLRDAGVVEERHESSSIVRKVCAILRADRWELNISTESKGLCHVPNARFGAATGLLGGTVTTSRLNPAPVDERFLNAEMQIDYRCLHGIVVFESSCLLRALALSDRFAVISSAGCGGQVVGTLVQKILVMAGKEASHIPVGWLGDWSLWSLDMCLKLQQQVNQRPEFKGTVVRHLVTGKLMREMQGEGKLDQCPCANSAATSKFGNGRDQRHADELGDDKNLVGDDYLAKGCRLFDNLTEAGKYHLSSVAYDMIAGTGVLAEAEGIHYKLGQRFADHIEQQMAGTDEDQMEVCSAEMKAVMRALQQQYDQKKTRREVRKEQLEQPPSGGR